MSIISRKRDSREEGTVFRHASNGKILCRLDVSLGKDDWEQLQVLLALVYRQGIEAGSQQRAAEIRTALGLVS